MRIVCLNYSHLIVATKQSAEIFLPKPDRRLETTGRNCSGKPDIVNTTLCKLVTVNFKYRANQSFSIIIIILLLLLLFGLLSSR